MWLENRCMQMGDELQHNAANSRLGSNNNIKL